MRSALFLPLFAFSLVQPPPVHGSDTSGCLPLDKPVTLSGRLVGVDQNGYVEWIDLVLPRPICTLADPTQSWRDALHGVTGIEVVGVDIEATESQLRRLLGKKVALTGALSRGVQRSPLILVVASIQPTDAAGRALLSAPDRSAPAVRDVPEYEVSGPGRSVDEGRSQGERNRQATETRKRICAPLDDGWGSCLRQLPRRVPPQTGQRDGPATHPRL